MKIIVFLLKKKKKKNLFNLKYDKKNSKPNNKN